MPRKRQETPPKPQDRDASPLDKQVWESLSRAGLQVSYNLTDDTVYELRLRLRTPGIFALYKADVPAPGLPMLDGFLKFVAFRQAMDQVSRTMPGLIDALLWQWNLALRQAERWIDFSIPIRKEVLSSGIAVYDCSVGLPVEPGSSEVLYPAGAFFACGANLVTYPSEERGPADSIALRRRSAEPIYRPLELTGNLDTQSGGTKALDNRIYFTLTREYAFFFRGDKDGVKNLLKFACEHEIGIGKKTSLGYGRIDGFEIRKSCQNSTLGHVIALPAMQRIALLKNIPYQELQRRCLREHGDYVPMQKLEGGQWKDILTPDERSQNARLFGAREFGLAAPIEAFDCYRPPYWRREGRTLVLRYGTLLVPRK